MSDLFTMFLAQFMAPIPITVGIAGAFFSRSWWHVLLTALVAAGASEVFLRMNEAGHKFDLLTFLVGLFAAGLWAAWFYWIRLSRKKYKEPPSGHP